MAEAGIQSVRLWGWEAGYLTQLCSSTFQFGLGLLQPLAFSIPLMKVTLGIPVILSQSLQPVGGFIAVLEANIHC